MPPKRFILVTTSGMSVLINIWAIKSVRPNIDSLDRAYISFRDVAFEDVAPDSRYIITEEDFDTVVALIKDAAPVV